VAAALTALRPQPPNFRSIVELNRGPLETGTTELLPLTPRQVEQRRADGALLVDVRTDFQFDEAHVEDAVCITALHGGFGTKLAWLAAPDREIVFVGRDDADGELAARLAVAVGVRDLGGYLSGGLTSWRAERRPVERIDRVTVDELHDMTGDGDGVQILDVREQSEWDRARIPGSTHVPYHDINSLPKGLDPAEPVAVICASGQRSAVAASLLKAHGAGEVIHVVDGGVGTWQRLGFPIERA